MIRSLKSIASVLLLLVMPNIAVAAGQKSGEKETISIGELKIQPSVSELARKQRKISELKLISNSLEVQLVSALNSTRVFQIMEFESSIAPELDQGVVPVEEDSDARGTMPPKEKFVVKYTFLPYIDGFDDVSETTDHEAIGRSSLSRKIFLSASVRIVDTATSRLLPDSPAIQLSKVEEVKNAKIGQAAFSDQVLVAMAREMAQKLSLEVVLSLRPAKVLSVTGKQLLINRGTEAGFEKGDLVEIYAVRKVKDDDTGEEFSDETLVGQAIITRLDKKQSFANISGDDTGVVKGAVVRRMKSAAARKSEQERQPSDSTLPDFEGDKKSGTDSGSGEKPLKWK